MTFGGSHAYTDDNHKLERWTFATAAARLAFTGYDAPAAVDVARVAFQVDDGSYWRLTNHSPIAWLQIGGSGGGESSSPSHAYFETLAALLEPAALLPIKLGTFTYAIASNETKHLIASFSTRLSSDGRMELRDPRQPLPLRGVTLAGLSSDATAIVLDPSLPDYDDAWTTYHDRLQALAELPTKYLPFTAASQSVPFLPGAHGAIVLHATNFNFTWVIAKFGPLVGYNLANELGDDGSTQHQRNANRLMLPVHKHTINYVQSGASGGDGTALGGIVYVLLPANWSKVPDPHTYLFRDDFMGDTIDTATTWNKVENYAGGVKSDPLYHWLWMDGGGDWGLYSLIAKTGVPRVVGTTMEVDVFLPATAHALPLIGMADGVGNDDSNFAHCLVMDPNNNALAVYENGNARGAVGSGCTSGYTYRVRIVLTSAGATYWIQGGTQYQAMGGSAWTNITPVGSSSPTATLYPGLLNVNHPVFFSDVRVY